MTAAVPEEKISDTDPSDVLKTAPPTPKYRLRSKPVTVSPEEFRTVFRLNGDRKPLEYASNDYEDNGDGTVRASDEMRECRRRAAYPPISVHST
ncbi:MAG: hypothetical protein B6245_17920 [Desulfobacteraceae bacterium 4572_88]|nr:MAG: hypothetical protein B6245_17920 [Desulfobacteraceae bacterium 4572_88]